MSALLHSDDGVCQSQGQFFENLRFSDAKFHRQRLSPLSFLPECRCPNYSADGRGREAFDTIGQVCQDVTKQVFRKYYPVRMWLVFPFLSTQLKPETNLFHSQWETRPGDGICFMHSPRIP